MPTYIIHAVGFPPLRVRSWEAAYELSLCFAFCAIEWEGA